MQRAITTLILTASTTLLGATTAVCDGLAIGAPWEDIGSVEEGGAVNVLYGNTGGLTVTGSQMWNQDTAGIPGMAEEFDHFGKTLASGDFNGDGRPDLAIGVPFESIDGNTYAGLVHVLYADGSGHLTADGHQWWYQGLNGLAGGVESGDQFADALAAGDFDNDGFDDLAVGVRFEDIGSIVHAGAVHVIYGSSVGLTSTGNQFWNQGTTGIHGVPEENDRFGSQLATGDFDNDGYDDLAISSPYEEVGGYSQAGIVHVLYGSSSGITADDNYFWADPFLVQDNARFGKSLATGDLNGDGCDDLAIGSPNMNLSGFSYVGWVTILFGAPGGMSTLEYQTIAQGAYCNGFRIQDDQEEWDLFGNALAIGDFNGDGRDDLAVSADEEDVGSIEGAGVVHILFGTSTGLTGENNQLWHQDLATVWGDAENWDCFGMALTTGDFDNDGRDDLAVGVPYEDFDSLDSPGLVHIFRGGANGPTSGMEVWTQSDVPGAPEDGDIFGRSLAVLRSGFDGLFADGFESGDLSAWATSSP